MAERNDMPTCEKCSTLMRRDYTSSMVGFGEHERVSRALGVAPNQIEQAMKLHPNAKFDREGNMILKNRTEKKQRLKERGWVEYD
jgi:hypothetical protein